MVDRGRRRSFDRAAALHSAMEVFWAKGYDGASLTDLTMAMGINPPSMYAAFGSKEDLFREAVELYNAAEGKDIWSGIEQATTARGAVEAMLHASAESYFQPGKPRGCLVVLGALNAGANNTAICDMLHDMRAAGVKQLRRRIERAMAQGELPETTDARAIANFYISVQYGMSILARDGTSRKMLATVADSAMAAWDGLVAST